MMRLSLAGNPNCGKTTLYNTLTGELESVGNWTGVTVEAHEVVMKTDYGDAIIVDLPGAYSITPYSSEESLSLEYINAARSDVIINIVDINNLSRSLYFTTQLMELRIPMMIALNKVDILQDEIDTKKLALALGCPVIPISAERGDCLREMVILAATASRPAKRDPFQREVERFAYIESILDQVYIKKIDRNQLTIGDKLDRILTNKLTGLPCFFVILWLIFFLSQKVVGGFFSWLITDVLISTVIQGGVEQFYIGIPPLLQRLLIDGMLGGVGAVLGFVPLIMTLFFLLALLEDCGYMARVAVLMDLFFKKIGLSGKAIIPMVVGTGCSITGVMASRTLENENERKRLCILTPYIPCGRKLPVIMLFSALFFSQSTWMYPVLYALVILVIYCVGLLLRWVFTQHHEDTLFILELPQYRIPRLSFAFQHMLDRAWQFIKRATTIILVSNTLIWFLQHYTFHLKQAALPSESMLAAIGILLSPLFVPLGFGVWQLVVATLTGLVAKENVVSTLYLIYFTQGEELFLQGEGNPLMAEFTLVTAFSYLAFQLLSFPCFSALAVMYTEMKSKRWFSLGICIQFTTGYGVSFIICQVGTWLTTGHLHDGTLTGIVVLLCLSLLITIGRRSLRQPIHSASPL